MGAPGTSPVRVGKPLDFWILGKLYSSRPAADHRLFHPFPGGRWVAPWIFLVLLGAQRFYRILVRWHPTWGFVFVVHPGDRRGTLDAFVYYRVRRRSAAGDVANIGTFVGPAGRGKGIGPQLIVGLMAEARDRGVRRIETGVYENNSASIRMCEKLGFRTLTDPASRRKDAYGVELTLVRDLEEPDQAEASPRATPTQAPPIGSVPTYLPIGIPPESPRSPPSQRAATLAALLVAFAAIAYVRLVLLFSSPYPPSGDIAEQLYWTHIWLGTAFPSTANAWWVPPVYIFTIYLPFTHFFPLFTGQRLLMGIVPALLVFPTYLLLRECDVGRPFSLFGASLLALAPSVSLMVTWNAGYNLFGMFWALFFFAGLAGMFRTGRSLYLILAALGFGLTAGTHYFTFAFLCLGFAYVAVLALLLLPARRSTARTLGTVALWSLVSALPFALVYITLVQQTSNVGGGVTLAALGTLFQNLLPFASGAQALWSPLLFVDAALMVVGIGVLLATRLRRPETPVLGGILLSGLTWSIVYPQEADRGLYFVPLGLYPIVAILFQVVYDRVLPRKLAAAQTSESSAEPMGRRSSSRATPRPGLRRASWAKPTVAFLLTGAFLLLNAQQSLVVMNAADRFYAQLAPDDLPVLNWLADNTSIDAAVLTVSTSLEPWIWGYANRQAYAPSPLNLEATTVSYDDDYLANLATMGSGVLSDAYLTVAENAPSPIGEPLIYLRTPYFWNLLLSTASTNVNLTVTAGGQVVELSLASAVVESSWFSTPCAGCVGEDQVFSWPGQPFSVLQETNLSGETVSLYWEGLNDPVEAVNFTTYLVPSSFGTSYANVSAQTGQGSLTDSFSLNAVPLTMSLGGPTTAFRQVPLPSGWTELEFDGAPELTISFEGLAANGPGTPLATTSSALLSELGVTYIVTDYNDSVPDLGYLTYLRCATPDEFADATVSEVFESSSIYIFEIFPT